MTPERPTEIERALREADETLTTVHWDPVKCVYELSDGQRFLETPLVTENNILIKLPSRGGRP